MAMSSVGSIAQFSQSVEMACAGPATMKSLRPALGVRPAALLEEGLDGERLALLGEGPTGEPGLMNLGDPEGAPGITSEPRAGRLEQADLFGERVGIVEGAASRARRSGSRGRSIP
jgi:hypothetical protein